MAFVVSDLPDFKKLNREEIIRKAVLGGNFIGRMTKQTGIKKDALINYLATTPVLQSGASCGFSASGDAAFTQRTISTAAIKVNMSFCPQTLLGKYTEYQVRLAANPNAEMMPFEQEIIEDVLARLNKKSEVLVWQGDTTQTTDADKKWYNGLIKLALADSAVHDVTVASGKSAYDAIKDTYLAIPEDCLDRAQIFVNPAVYRQFMQELVDRNYFHYSAGEGAPSEFIFPGTDTKVVKVEGLAGANYMMAADPSELFYGCDLENDREDARVWFSDDDDIYKLKISWNAGVNYAFGDNIVLTSYSTLTSPADNSEAVAGIATAVAGINTSVAGINTNVAGLNDTDKVFKTKEQQ